jgi:hypothetical protein
MSQNELPEPKPSFSLRVFWFLGLAATGIPGMIAALLGLGMVLTFLAVVGMRSV